MDVWALFPCFFLNIFHPSLDEVLELDKNHRSILSSIMMEVNHKERKELQRINDPETEAKGNIVAVNSGPLGPLADQELFV